MKIVVFSDLDATLLDAETYSWRSAEEAIDALKKREAAIILVTSKTLSEVVLLHEELGLEDPFIFENGGGIAACKGTPLCEHLISWEPKINEFHKEGFVVFPLGMRYEILVTDRWLRSPLKSVLHCWAFPPCPMRGWQMRPGLDRSKRPRLVCAYLMSPL